MNLKRIFSHYAKYNLYATKNQLAPSIKEDKKCNTRLFFKDACHVQIACMLGKI